MQVGENAEEFVEVSGNGLQARSKKTKLLIHTFDQLHVRLVSSAMTFRTALTSL
jgi:hypothetical protein